MHDKAITAIIAVEWRVGLVDVDHAVEECPEEDVGEDLAEEPVGEKLLSAGEVLFPARAHLPENHQPKKNNRDNVEDEAGDGRQAQNTGRAAGQCGHGGPAKEKK